MPYSVAVLPYIDQSGMDEKGRKVAANAIKDALKEKYPPAKKGGVNTVASAKAVAKAMQNHPFENADAPVLAELVAVGKELGVDRRATRKPALWLSSAVRLIVQSLP